MAEKNWIEKLNSIIAYGFYLWIFLLPWQTRYFYQAHLAGGPWEAGSLSMYVSEIILLVLLFLRFILWTSEKDKFNFNYKKKYFLFFTFLIIFVVYIFISIFWSVFPALTIYYSLKLLLALGVFWLIQNKKITLIRVATVLVAAGALQGLLAIWQFLDQFIPASKWLGIALQDSKELGVSVVDTGIRRWLRGYGSFPHPNILGGFLTITLIFALYIFDQSEFLWQKLKSKKIQVYQMSIMGAIVMIASGIVLSFSRAAWLASILAILFIAILSFTKNKFMSFKTLAMTVVCIATVVIMWVSVYTEPFVTRATSNGYLETMSVNQRLDSLTDAWQMFKKRPLLGVGFGVYTYALHQTFPERTIWQLQPPHNTYLLIAVELGVIGFILFGIFFILPIWRYRQNSFFMLLYIVIIFLMMFDYWWWSLNFGWYLLFILIAIQYKNLEKNERSVKIQRF